MRSQSTIPPNRRHGLAAETTQPIPRGEDTHPRRINLVLAVLMVVATGCASSASSAPTSEPVSAKTTEAATAAASGQAEVAVEIGTVTLSDSDCTLDLAQDPVRAGQVELVVVNNTGATGAFDMGRIHDSSSYEELETVITAAIRAAEASEEMVPRPSFLGSGLLSRAVQGGESQTLTGTLTAGTYGLVCLGTYEVGVRPVAVLGPIEVVD